jgi:hypothetical protein
MFVNKWTARMNYPGQMVETGFDSKEELMVYVRGLRAEGVEGLGSIITVYDPNGAETSITVSEALLQLSTR